MTYDALGRLTSDQYTYTPTGGSASTLYQAQPTYDALSNVLGVTTTLPQGVDTQVFCYDDLSRLTWAGSSGTPGCSGAPTPSDTGSLAGTGASSSAGYSYDVMNRLTSSPLGSYAYGDASHADAATAVGASWTASYDAAGNMTCRAATSAQTCAGSSPTGALLGDDNEGRLVGWQNAQTAPTQSASYLYDGEGQRVQQQVNVAGSTGTTTTTTSSIGSLEEVSTRSDTGATTTTAYYGGIAESVNGTLSYLLSDGLGSVSESVATDGTVSATQLYAPYGSVRYQSGTLPTAKGFTGQREDAATGLDYYNARSYDPVAGQFTSADTTLAGGVNRYGYVGGNPETNTDPSGHLIVSQREYSRTLANEQAMAQPAQVYFGSVGAFAAGLPQFFLGTDTLRQVFHTIFQDPQASTGAKVKAAVAGAATLGTDVVTLATTFVGEPEVGADLRAADEGMLTSAEVANEAAVTTSDVTAEASPTCGLSFAAATQVETPSGERPIASLHVGSQVSAYDPTTGKATTETVTRVFLNHDRDRLDVTLATSAPASQKTQAAAQSGHGRHAAHAAHAATRTMDEVIHTTANHPWLTADHGWLVAGTLRVGEPVRLLDGGTATVEALHALPGVGPMWDLSLDATHTFAVGDAQVVVHNCGDGSSGGGKSPAIYEKNADHIFDPDKANAGHFPIDTPANREALIETASDPKNLQGTDRFGNDVYTSTQSDGSQLWAYVRNGTEIRDGGINLLGRARIWDPILQELVEP